ncbi:MAG TPA: 3'-phosphoesterase [Candidatus Bathyarchaeota archaeon]|nr:3'-phosphoesterase [Candidatus Bathyarchaeota archaeon]
MPIFVVHEHDARRLHWDLRLEIDGVLKSWAVPKKPPTVKGVKRLAIQVEDHPIEYADFEGVIPKGMYGAGTVKIWDKGKVIFLERSPRKLVFILNGKFLKGKYILLRFPKAGEDAWLFFKG